MGAGKSKRAGKYGTKKSKERGEGLSRRSLLFFEPYFSARLDFPSPPHFQNGGGVVGGGGGGDTQQSFIGDAPPRGPTLLIACELTSEIPTLLYI